MRSLTFVLALVTIVFSAVGLKSELVQAKDIFNNTPFDPDTWYGPGVPGYLPPERAYRRTHTTPIYLKYQSLSGARGVLGKPVDGVPISSERSTPDKLGKFVRFQNGSIYWTPKTGAHAVQGAILAKWASLNWERGVLGYPLTDETPTPDKVGRFNHFQKGSIYWTPQTGAHEVRGDIFAKWAALGWERSSLGYPVSDEFPTADGRGRRSNFQRGYIDWYPGRGAVVHQN